jgi:CBS domain-containing protein
MRIRDLINTPPFTCNETDALCRAAQLMWEHDCGCVPVLDAAGRPRASGAATRLCSLDVLAKLLTKQLGTDQVVGFDEHRGLLDAR